MAKKYANQYITEKEYSNSTKKYANDRISSLDEPYTPTQNKNAGKVIQPEYKTRRETLQEQLKAAQNRLTTIPDADNAIASSYDALKQIAIERLNAERDVEKYQKLLDAYDYQDKYFGKSYADSFWGQSKANYTLGRLSQDSAQAWNEVYKHPTEANKIYAEAIDDTIARFQNANEDVLDDEGAVLPWLSQSFAGYIPQFIDQAKAQVGGALAGAAIGSSIPIVGTAAGAKAGYVAGAGLQSFDTMRGSAYKSLLDAGVPEDVAREAAGDEAVISSLVEMADAGIDVATLGIGKLMNTLTKGASQTALNTIKGKITNTVAQNAALRLGTALGKYGINVLSEGLEEETQEAVSIANQNRIARGDADTSLWKEAYSVFVDDYLHGQDQENQQQIKEAGKEGRIIAGITGGLIGGSNYLLNNALVNRASKKNQTMDTAVKKGEVTLEEDTPGIDANDAPISNNEQLATVFNENISDEKAQVNVTENSDSINLSENDTAINNNTQTEPTRGNIDVVDLPSDETKNNAKPNDIAEQDNTVTKDPDIKQTVSDTEAITTPADAQAQSDPEIENTNRMVQESSVVGKHGKEAFIRGNDGKMSQPDYYKGFMAMYNAGLQNRGLDTGITDVSVNMTGEQIRSAYGAGQDDRLDQMVRQSSTYDTTKETVRTTEPKDVRQTSGAVAAHAAGEDTGNIVPPTKSEYNEDAQKKPTATTTTKSAEPESKPAKGAKAKPNKTKSPKWEGAKNSIAWYTPTQNDKSRPIAYSTVSDRDLIEMYAEENPTATVKEIQSMLTYSPDGKKVLQQYIDAGYGDTPANGLFRYGRTEYSRPSQWVNEKPSTQKPKGGLKNADRVPGSDAEAVLETVPDAAGVQQPDTTGSDAGEVLDTMAAQNVQGNEGQRDLVSDTERGREPAGRPDAGPDTEEQLPGGRGVGDNQGTDILDAAGEIETPAVTQEQQEISQKEDIGNRENPKGDNFVLSAQTEQEIPTTPKTRYTANVDAIKTLRRIIAENRPATAEEQASLAKYTGWGGLSDAFDQYKKEWATEYNELKALLSDSEYKTAKASILDAYYTEPNIIRAMYKGLESIGFKGGRMLEPSAGTGRFIGAMPETLTPKVQSWVAVELDEVTGNISKYLYPNAQVRIEGFEKTKLPDDYMDMVIGNVPFGNISVYDRAYPSNITKSIHNYFIAKSLDKTRPGGIVAVITSRETLDATNNSVRLFLMQKADLIGAIRLPNTAFKGTGTQVVSDILIFKKRAPGTSYSGEAFSNSVLASLQTGGRASINEYFINHPDMQLGIPKNTYGRYGTQLTYDPLQVNKPLDQQIQDAFKNITATMDYPEKKSVETIRDNAIKAGSSVKEGGIVKQNGKLYKNEKGNLIEVNVKSAEAAKLSKVIEIRDTARQLLNMQLANQDAEQIKRVRAQLNELYDAFVKEHGPLSKAGNARIIKKDIDAPFMFSLEKYNADTKTASKTAIFYQDTVVPEKTISFVNSVEEGITVTMNETGVVDIARIAQLMQTSEAEVEKYATDNNLVYKTKNGGYETAEQYLSGNVRAKLKEAEALSMLDPSYQRNVDALKKVVPADIAPADIKVRIGATWIPDSLYSQFATELLGGKQVMRDGEMRYGIEVKYNKALGQFTVKANDYWLLRRPENLSEWGTKEYNFIGSRGGIFEAALNNKNASVYNKDANGNRILNRQATAAAQEKLNKILDRFQEWLWQDEERRNTLAPLYNDLFNNTVVAKYDGSNLTIAGSSSDKPMRPHQKSAVQKIINSGGNTLLAHRVGAGKTYEMAAAAMKLRQLGVIKKPVIIVPKHLVAQWGNEFLSYFPAANIQVLEADDFTPAKRKIFANRIATNDSDAIIMSYEQFAKIPMSTEAQQAFYQEQIDALELAIAESKGDRISVRDMERSKKALEAKMEKLADTDKDQNNITFEELGIDALFVDEAHNFKNLFYVSKMQGVADLGNKEGSKRAFDLYMKTRYLQKLNGGRGIVFATATPVTNSAVELYTMQRYLQGDLLEAKGLSNFDAWANQFGEVISVRKMKPGGNGYEIKQSFSRYKNLPELQQMIGSFADVITDAKDLPYLKIPTMKTGKRIVIECEPGDFQLAFMEELGKRAEALRGPGKGGKEDHVFKILDDGKKISYTQRMIDPSLPYETEGKIYKSADMIYRKWQDTKADKGTQLVFCDRGTPGGAEAQRGISIYEDLKNLLVGKGIPPEEIAFIHDAETDAQKSELFKKVNEGSVRVLIGSSAKMGTGMNVQQRIAAIHELNAPDRPADLEQNEGRALRQGNMYDEVEVYTYVTKKTFDSRQWDMLKRKSTFIHQILAGEYNGREASGDGEFALSAAEISAIASDNPLIIEQFELSEKITTLEDLARAHNKEIADALQKIKKANNDIAVLSEQLDRYQKDIKLRKDTSGKNFEAIIGKRRFAERKAAGEAIVAKAKSLLDISATEETATTIGQFAGFDLQITNKGNAILKGNAQYMGVINMQSPLGTIQVLEAVPRRLESAIANVEKQLSEARAAIPKYEEIAKQPFAKAKELQEARKRETEINLLLNPTNETNMQNAEYEAWSDEELEGAEEYSLSAEASSWAANRIKNGKVQQPQRLSDLIEQLKHDFGFNITTGHIRGANKQGQFNTKNKGIRIKKANDLPTISHEMGHFFGDKYGILKHLTADAKKELINGLSDDMKALYKEKQWASEGLAEFLRKYLLNREETAYEYPVFTADFLNSLTGTDAALIMQFADETNAYFALDADSATSSIRLNEESRYDARTIREKLVDAKDALVQAWTDSNRGIKLFDREAGTKRAYIMATNAAYSDAVAYQIITGDLTDQNGRYIAPGLKSALSEINLKDEGEYREFGEYLVVKHGPERLKEGMDIFADPKKNNEEFMDKRAAELEKKYPAFKAAADKLYKFQDQFLNTWGVETGLVSPESADSWHKRWQYYVPLNRAVGDKYARRGSRRTFANQDSTIRKARGSTLDIIHPVDNIIYNITRMVIAGKANGVMQVITNIAERMGVNALWLEKIPTLMVGQKVDLKGIKADLLNWFEESKLDSQGKEIAAEGVNGLNDIIIQYRKGKAHGNIITVMKNGKQEFWKINDPMLLESITHMTPAKLSGVMEAVAMTSRFMTANITGNNIVWSIFSNAPRDLMTAAFYAGGERGKLISGIASAYINKARLVTGKGIDPIYRQYLALGGGQDSAYTADIKLAKKARKAFKGQISFNPLDQIAIISNTIESGPRFAFFKALIEKGVDPQEAFYQAMDLTVNFRRSGILAREVNKLIPFFNMAVQSLDKFRRYITAEDLQGDNRKTVVKNRVATWVAANAILAALIYAVNNHDDEAEKEYEQLSSFTKNTYWPLPLGDGKYFTIPKPRELAVLSSFFERSLEYGAGQNKHAFDEFGDYAADLLLPNTISDIAKGDMAGAIGSLGLIGTGAYMMANRDFLGRPIVSSGLQNLEPKDQYNDRTSKIAYAVGQAFNQSPQMIDYFFNATLGGWWKYQTALFPVGSQNIDPTLGVKGTYIKDSLYSTDLVNWLYDKSEASTQKKNSNPEDMQAAITAKMDSNMTSFYSRFYSLTKNGQETDKTRTVRQMVLTMIQEYRDQADSGSTTNEQQAVYSVCEEKGTTEYLPSVMPNAVKDGNGQTHTLSGTQYVEYQTEYNGLYWDYVESAYNATDTLEQRAAVLSAAKDLAKEQATDRVLSRLRAPTTGKTAKYNGITGKDIIEFEAQTDIANNDGSLTQQEVIDIIQAMIVDGLSYDDAYILFHSRYESDRNNPWKDYK